MTTIDLIIYLFLFLSHFLQCFQRNGLFSLDVEVFNLELIDSSLLFEHIEPFEKISLNVQRCRTLLRYLRFQIVLKIE